MDEKVYLLGATGTSLSLNVGGSVCLSFCLSVCWLQLSRSVGCQVVLKKMRKPIHATSY